MFKSSDNSFSSKTTRASIYRRSTNLLGNLKFAIVLLLVIAFMSTLGTIIEQGKSPEFYKNAYPENSFLLSWKAIYFLQLNQVYNTWWYTMLLCLLGMSLTICTFKTQLPSLKIAKKWIFLLLPTQLRKLKISFRTPKQAFFFIIQKLNSENYYIFHRKAGTYAYRGLLGKIAPILVHISLLIILIGTCISAYTGYIAQEMVVKGEIFHLQNLSSFGQLTYIPQNIIGHVNDFWITYNQGQSNIDQFFSDISFLDGTGQEVKRQLIYVNKPLYYKGFTIYQTDWNIVGLRLNIDNQFIVQVPLSSTVLESGNKLWIGSLNSASKPLIFFTVDSLRKNSINLYNFDGTLLTTTSVDDIITVKQHTIHIMDVMASTGLQIKYDYGLPIIYAGFGLLIVSVLSNQISYNQVWISEANNLLQLGGKTNRDHSTMKRQLIKILLYYVKPS